MRSSFTPGTNRPQSRSAVVTPVREAVMPSNKHRLAWASVLATSAFLGSVACGSSSEAPAVQANELPEGPWLDGADPKQVLATSFCASPQPGDSPLRRLSNLE